MACPPDNSDNPNIGVPTLQKLLLEHLKGRKVRFTRGDEVLTGIERTEIQSLPKYMFVCVAKRKPKTNPLLCLSPVIALPTDAKKAKAILVGHAHHRGTHKSGHYTVYALRYQFGAQLPNVVSYQRQQSGAQSQVTLGHTALDRHRCRLSLPIT